jgi:hypothetical protein
VLAGADQKDSKEAEEKALLSKWRSLLKKCLTEPTLLEMSGERYLGTVTWLHRSEAMGGRSSKRGNFRVILHAQTHGSRCRLSQNAMRRPYSECVA